MLYVALGRNVGDEPMPEEEFGFMRNEVVGLFGSPDTVAYGNSSWAGDVEETCVLVWFDRLAVLSQDEVRRLGDIARAYEQEAIAYSVSVPEFVEGVK
jgi:hypothetical protein